MKQFACSFLVILTFAAACFAQEPAATPPRADTEKIFVEEIRLNVSGILADGRPADDISEKDLVIMEDGRLHQPRSVRRVPASVLIAMDTGGENRQKKNISTTRKAAEKILDGLEPDAQIALMHFHDKVEFLSEWTSEKPFLSSIIRNKTGFGRRTAFTAAMNAAIDFMETAPTENRHLVLITEGLDSEQNMRARSEMIKELWKSGIVVHVLSYTQIEYSSVKRHGRIWRGGDPNPNRMPAEVAESIKNSLPYPVFETIYLPRLFSIVVDVPYLGDRKSLARALRASHSQLSAMAEFTGGEYILPEKLDEVTEKAALVAKAINSQFVVSYVPLRPLGEVDRTEVRRIEVSSRRPGLSVTATRMVVVYPRSTEEQ